MFRQRNVLTVLKKWTAGRYVPLLTRRASITRWDTLKVLQLLTVLEDGIATRYAPLLTGVLI